MQKQNPKKPPRKESSLSKRHNSASKPRNAAKTTPQSVQNVCVYCGSGSGAKPAYAIAARSLGSELARAGIGLVYGGGGLGLMGEVARAAINGGGRVTGIIPSFLSELEHMLKDADELIITQDMHERKQLMFEKSDAFVALPGGIGTLEELVEQLTWSQLGQHKKPVVIANINGYWSPFLDLIAHMKREEFIRDTLDVGFHVVDHAKDILPTIISAHKSNIQSSLRTKSKREKTSVIAKM